MQYIFWATRKNIIKCIEKDLTRTWKLIDYYIKTLINKRWSCSNQCKSVAFQWKKQFFYKPKLIWVNEERSKIWWANGVDQLEIGGKWKDK